MNPRFILFLLFSLPFLQLQATDRIVQESGLLGTYASITAAVNAASDGDRIVIVNRAGGLPWQENVSLTKSLTLMPAVDGTRFLVQGDFSVNPSSSGKHVRIVGMENLSGDIFALNSAPAGSRTKVEIVGSDIFGSINFQQDYFDILLASNIISEDASLRFGKVYGNDISNGHLGIYSDGLPSNDVIDIIGNKLNEMSWVNNTQFFRIANNYFLVVQNGAGYGIYCSEMKNSSTTVNEIVNNSFHLDPSACCAYTQYGIRFNSVTAPNAQVDILNNAMSETTSNTTYGIRALSSNINVFTAYNHISSSFSVDMSGVPNGATNVVNSAVTIAANGQATGSAITNGGHPGNAYTDHDLSRNDPGAYGGSFNLENYFPITVGPHVFHVEAPRALFQGANLNVTAEGYDR